MITTIQLVTMFAVSVDEYIFPDKEVKKSSVRRRLNAELDKLNDKELSVIEATVIGLCDLSVVKHISNNIVVMYLGQCLEFATSDELFASPVHPYTKALLSAIPEPDISMRNKEIKVIKGEVVSPVDPKPGCRFAARCEYCQERCTQEAPTLKEVSPGHFVACHLCEN